MSEEKSKIENLVDALYSRTKYKNPVDKRASLETEEATPVRGGWNSGNLDEILKGERRREEGHPVLKKVFFVAIAFFVIATIIAAYMFWGGGNFISSKNVDITIRGPATVSAGDGLDLGLTISNKNNTNLESANLSIDYPTGTRDATNTAEALTHTKETIGVIGAGKDLNRTLSAIFFGEKGEIKTLKVVLEYKVSGSNATFSKEKDYDIAIGEVPVSISVSGPSSVISGENFDTTLTLTSNSNQIIKNVAVRTDYPYGFTLVGSNPKTINGDNVWLLGDMALGDKKTITLTGQLVGENSEERTIRFYAGVASSDNQEVFDVPLSGTSETVSIGKPSLGLVVTLNGDNSDTYIAPSGGPITVSLNFVNNLPSKVLNAHLEAQLSGALIDKLSVSPQNGGTYDSNRNVIAWDSSGDPDLKQLIPGNSGQVSFHFASISNPPTGIKNQAISLTFNLSGTPSGAQSIKVSDTRSVKIASEISLASRALFSRGPFKNTGPTPPQANKETSYTIIMDLGNTQNDISGGKLTANLGQNVKWLASSPGNEKISYDSVSNQVTWDVGTLASGAGFSTAGREGIFQVALTPSTAQIGGIPTLVNNISFSGTDTFTQSTVTVVNPTLTTRISSDPNFIQGDDIVVK